MNSILGCERGQPLTLDIYKAAQSIGRRAHANRTRMQERDPERRRAELRRLQDIAADPAGAREYLLRSSMITGLRQSEAID